MQNNRSSNWKKKILYITLSVVLVVAVAFATAYILSLVSGSASNKESSEIPLPEKLIELYKNSSSGGDQSVTLGTVIVQESGTVGFKNAHAKLLVSEPGGNNETAYFYQTPDKTWHFFASAQDQDKISCGSYNTEDLVNAFIGFTCLDTATGKSSYVQREPTKFEIVPGSLGG